MDNKRKYKEFCNNEINIPIFSQPWWLDAVCGGDNWDVVLYEKGGHIWASLPFYIKVNYGFTFLSMPLFTQKLGPYVKYPNKQKYYKRLSWEKECLTYLFENLPSYDIYNQNFDYIINNWLPLYWMDYKQTTKYTYVINKNQDVEKSFENDIKRRYNKAKENNVEVIESHDIRLFYEINKKTFDRKEMKIPHTFNELNNLYNSAKKNNAVKIFVAMQNDNIIAGAMLVYDCNTVYYILGGVDDELKSLGGMDAVLIKCILFANESSRNFDFEGSMVESIEKYFRSFGALQKRYFNIKKYNSKLFKLVKFIKEL